MIPFHKTLYWKISQIFLLLLTAFAIAEFLLYTHLFRSLYDRSMQGLYSTVARDLVVEMTPLVSPELDFGALAQLAHRTHRAYPQSNLFLLAQDGKVLLNLSEGLDNDDNLSDHVDIRPIAQYLADAAGASFPIYSSNPGTDVRYATFSAAPLEILGHPGFVYVTFANEAFNHMWRVLWENSAIFAGTVLLFLSIAACALLGLGLFYRLTGRFYRLTSIVSDFAHGDFTRRVDAESDDEIAEHGRAVNQLADAIEGNLRDLRRRDDLRRELISDISHDLRRPVALISGYSEVLLTGQSTLDEQSRGYCRSVAASASSLQRLVDELFELSKLESREVVPRLEPFAPAELLNDIFTAFIPNASGRGIDLQVELPPQLPLVTGDITLISRVLSNLLENALRYTPAGGTVTLRAEEVTEGRVLIEVRDTGLGIAEADLPFVFERLYQGRPSSQESSGLSGLGLAIVKRIVEAHGATVRVESKEHQGAAFSFTLPTVAKH